MNASGNSAIDMFWQQYIDASPKRLDRKPYAGAFAFGNNAELADEIAKLVVGGSKTATSMLVWELEAEHQMLWHVGDESIVLDGAGKPVCIVQTTQLEVKPFNAVDDQFVHDYGEGDRSFEWWNHVMKDYYFELAKKLHKKPSEDMPLICERFTVVFPPSR